MWFRAEDRLLPSLSLDVPICFVLLTTVKKNQLVVAGRRGWNSAKFDLLMIHNRIVGIEAKIDIGEDRIPPG